MRSLAFRLVLVLSTISAVWSIKCWVCNSHWNGNCGENFKESPKMIADCDEFSSDLYPPLKATFCRKILQKTYGQVRVIRSCGFILNKPSRQNKCEFNSFVKASESTYCECNKDFCNGIGRTSAEWRLVALLPMALIVMKCLWL